MYFGHCRNEQYSLGCIVIEISISFETGRRSKVRYSEKTEKLVYRIFGPFSQHFQVFLLWKCSKKSISQRKFTLFYVYWRHFEEIVEQRVFFSARLPISKTIDIFVKMPPNTHCEISRIFKQYIYCFNSVSWLTFASQHIQQLILSVFQTTMIQRLWRIFFLGDCCINTTFYVLEIYELRQLNVKFVFWISI